MTIIKTSNDNMTAKDLYDMVRSPEILKMSSISVDETLYVLAYVLREDVNKDGEPVQILSIKDEDGVVYGTNSCTFIKDFFDILELCEQAGTPLNAVHVLHSQSKNGRPFIQCVYVS